MEAAEYREAAEENIKKARDLMEGGYSGEYVVALAQHHRDLAHIYAVLYRGSRGC